MPKAEKLIVPIEANAEKAIKELEKVGIKAKKAGDESKRAGEKSKKAWESTALSAGAVVAALTAVAGATFKVIEAFAELERSQLKTQALIKATGNAAGITTDEFEKLSHEMGFQTLQSIEGTREAINILQTFKQVQGDTFKRAIRLSGDLAEVMGTDLRNATLQLAKALESPEQNLGVLNRSGVSFTKTQQKMIKDMFKMGQVAKSQGLILDAVAGQIEGAGKKAAFGVAGMIDNVTQNFTIFMQRMGNAATQNPLIMGILKLMSNPSEFVSEESKIEASLLRLSDQIAKAESNRTAQNYVKKEKEVQKLFESLYKQQDRLDALRLKNIDKVIVKEEESFNARNGLIKTDPRKQSFETAKPEDRIVEIKAIESQITDVTITEEERKRREIELTAELRMQKIKQSALYTLQMGSMLMSAADGQSRALFNIGKALALGNAINAGIVAVQQSYANSGGYPWGIPAAIAMGVIQAANVARIAKTQYGAGQTAGTAPRVSSFSNFTTSPVLGGQNNTQQAIINDLNNGILSLNNKVERIETRMAL